jgi:hypothetical protein
MNDGTVRTIDARGGDAPPQHPDPMRRTFLTHVGDVMGGFSVVNWLRTIRQPVPPQEL